MKLQDMIQTLETAVRSVEQEGMTRENVLHTLAVLNTLGVGLIGVANGDDVDAAGAAATLIPKCLDTSFGFHKIAWAKGWLEDGTMFTNDAHFTVH